ncbi:MAG: bifunctional diaminohydroxyphosphoribosylaminopyrimidine deaminase/5-amino-6-(5-phosphoribosylamino)uracil reductase RibD, partial [Granulosicoccus sp.]|nr:bifunctional diaminohydroxyphosphoribosylaminopyrimidine deaminase/5-amino-6-(5-phosphoribosylamino)uracil reductase RibD [Granulosicoccus sp.]
MQSHEEYMQRALALASRGIGCTSPNPLVGCVLVHDSKIIGQGWHERYGHAHAEVNALAQATQAIGGPIPSRTTLYVTLEPCNHYGLTPPCTQVIIDAGVAHVVYALRDPNPKAAGGAHCLEKSGLSVTSGVLESQARFQNRFFLKHLATGMPFVVAKSASSLDGKTATRTGHSQWITGPLARQRSHQLRQAVDAIIVGADTVIADNPALTVRLPESLCSEDSVCNPRPVILDSKGRVPLHTKLLSNISSSNRPIVATTHQMSADHRRILELEGVEVLTLKANAHGLGVDPQALLEALGQRAIQSVMLEGGSRVHGSFRDAQLID